MAVVSSMAQFPTQAQVMKCAHIVLCFIIELRDWNGLCCKRQPIVVKGCVVGLVRSIK